VKRIAIIVMFLAVPLIAQTQPPESAAKIMSDAAVARGFVIAIHDNPDVQACAAKKWPIDAQCNAIALAILRVFTEDRVYEGEAAKQRSARNAKPAPAKTPEPTKGTK
jgi:hypothetical protein